MTEFTPINDPDLEAEILAAFANYEANEQALEERWPELLSKHPSKWVAAYGGGIVVIADSLEEVASLVPPEHLGSSVLRLIEEAPRYMIL